MNHPVQLIARQVLGLLTTAVLLASSAALPCRGAESTATPASAPGEASQPKGGTSTNPKDVFNKPKAVAKINFENETVEVNVVLTEMFPKRRAKDAISAIQIGDYATAKKAFEDSLKEKKPRQSDHFGLAVCLEALGEYDAAKTHYAEANRIAGGQGSFDAQAGIKRIAARGR